jgi:hypothetical protein
MTEQTKNTVILPSEDERSRWCARLMNTTERPFAERVSELNNTEFIIDEKKYNDLIEQQKNIAREEVNCLVHPARVKYGDLSIVLKKVSNMQSFIKAIKKAGKAWGAGVAPDDEALQTDEYNKYVGDFFEIFAEFLIKGNSRNNNIGISKYRPINTSNGEEDYGVDGAGYGINGKPATVQIKFRSEMMNYQLTANRDHLSNFIVRSDYTHGVGRDDVDNMLVISTAGKVHWSTRDKMLVGKVRFLLLDQLEKMTNGIDFWDDFRSILAKAWQTPTQST